MSGFLVYLLCLGDDERGEWMEERVNGRDE